MRRTLHLAAMVCALAGALILIVPATAAADPVSCGDTVTADTTLVADLIGCHGTGIRIVADSDVTLDLDGHTVSGTGSGAGIDATTANGATVTVENGLVVGFDEGITAAPAAFPHDGRVVVHRVSAVRNAIGFRFSEIAVVVTDSKALSNAGAGISTGGSSPVRLVRNRVMHNGGNGIATPFSEPALIAYNWVTKNGGAGIYTTDATTSLVGNVASRNGSHGIYVSDDYMLFFPYWFQANVADSNGGYGIAFVSDVLTGPNGETVDGGGNSAKHNDGPAQCLNIVCASKP